MTYPEAISCIAHAFVAALVIWQAVEARRVQRMLREAPRLTVSVTTWEALSKSLGGTGYSTTPAVNTRGKRDGWFS